MTLICNKVKAVCDNKPVESTQWTNQGALAHTFAVITSFLFPGVVRIVGLFLHSSRYDPAIKSEPFRLLSVLERINIASVFQMV